MRMLSRTPEGVKAGLGKREELGWDGRWESTQHNLELGWPETGC